MTKMKIAPVNGSFTVDGNNVITTKQERILQDPRFAELTVQTAPDITWWKAIKIFDLSGQMVCMLETEDQDHGPKTSTPLQIGPPFNDNDVIRVEIWKGKTLGVHAHVDTVFFVASQ